MMKMNDCGGEYYFPYCSFHPKEVVVGICAPCLRERLLDLILKQGHHHHNVHKDYSGSRPLIRALRRKTSLSLPKVFALGSFLRPDNTRRRPRPDDGGVGDVSSGRGSIASLEDSFISIKFEDNGEASWESKKQDSMRRQQGGGGGGGGGKVLVEHSKPRLSTASLRWRKRMGQLLQLARGKRSAAATGAGAAGGSHVGKVEVGRRGWMRSLTARRRTTES